MKNNIKKDKRIAYLLWLTGGIGGHRWYLGQKGLATLFLLTGGGLGIWWITDLFRMDAIVGKVNGDFIGSKQSKQIISIKIAVLVVLLIVGNSSVISLANKNEQVVKAKELETIQTKPVEKEIEYTTEKVFIHDDPSAYSGRNVYEITIKGQFDLNSPTIKKDALKILNKEAEIGLKEQPTSVMVRVFIMQNGENELLSICSGTFDVVNGTLSLRELPEKLRYPLLNTIKH